MTTLYSFPGGAGGSLPGGVIYQGGFLYGETSAELASSTLFSVNASSGAAQTLATFGHDADNIAITGQSPLYYNGLLYDSTVYGGNPGCSPFTCGTVFTLNPVTGAQTVVYDFLPYGAGDSSSPGGVLVAVGGLLYGVSGGGANNLGSIYSINPETGAEAVVYSFGGAGSPQIHIPGSNLVYANGVLYGTTFEGGIGSCNKHRGCGAVFSFNLVTGVLTSLYEFAGGTHGQFPTDLSIANGKLYGVAGGTGKIAGGIIFQIDLTSGAYSQIFAFPAGGAGGSEPNSALIYQNGAFYGVAAGGGSSAACSGGCGVIYKLTPGKKKYSESVLFSFSSANGRIPNGLISQGSQFYGTTSGGGSADYGTVFSFTP